jgi:hypothetical protein
MPKGKMKFARVAPLARPTSTDLRLNYHIIRSRIVVEFAFVNPKEQYTVTLGHEIPPRSDQEKIVVVVADDRD